MESEVSTSQIAMCKLRGSHVLSPITQEGNIISYQILDYVSRAKPKSGYSILIFSPTFPLSEPYSDAACLKMGPTSPYCRSSTLAQCEVFLLSLLDPMLPSPQAKASWSALCGGHPDRWPHLPVPEANNESVRNKRITAGSSRWVRLRIVLKRAELGPVGRCGAPTGRIISVAESMAVEHKSRRWESFMNSRDLGAFTLGKGDCRDHLDFVV